MRGVLISKSWFESLVWLGRSTQFVKLWSQPCLHLMTVIWGKERVLSMERHWRLTLTKFELYRELKEDFNLSYKRCLIYQLSILMTMHIPAASSAASTSEYLICWKFHSAFLNDVKDWNFVMLLHQHFELLPRLSTMHYHWHRNTAQESLQCHS